MYMCVYVYMCVCVHVYECICAYVCACIHVFVMVCTCLAQEVALLRGVALLKEACHGGRTQALRSHICSSYA